MVNFMNIKKETAKIMLLQKRIELLEKQLNKLTKENQDLKRKYEELLHYPKQEFENVMKDIRILRKNYYQKVNELNQCILDYESNVDDLIFSIRSGVKGIMK